VRGARLDSIVTRTTSPHKRLFVQASHYSVASLLSTLAGLISFPLLTRIFSVADYGVMNLISATLTAALALGKVGVQHAIIRYRTETLAGKGQYSAAQLYATTFLGMCGTGLVAAVLLGVGAQLVPHRWLGDPRLPTLFAIASLVVLIQVAESIISSFLRADQKTAVLMKYQVGKRYFGLALILFAVFVVSRTLMAFYTAMLVTELCAVVALTLAFFRRESVPRLTGRDFSPPLYRELLAFGIPMMIGYELSGIVLGVGDRYVIHGMIGQQPLGLYSAAYNLCQYVQTVFVASVGQAVTPLYMQMFDQKGPEETTAFIGRSLRNYVLFGAPVIAGLAAVGPALLPALASERYSSAASIIPWVIAGMVVDGANTMVAAGLFIHRKTKQIMAVVGSAAILNVVLNIILVPRIGILGAAIATLVSYLLASGALTVAGRRFLPVRLPFTTIARAALAAVAMYLAVMHLSPGHHLATLTARMVVGAPVYLLLIALIDPDARLLVAKAGGRLRRTVSGAGI
jgi:O-antigen/teichoic acid export membrane protein